MQHRCPQCGVGLPQGVPAWVRQLTVAHAMTPDPVTISIQNPITVAAETPLMEAAQTLHTTKFGALPVLRDGRLHGMLTDTDLIRCLTGLLTHGG